MVTNNMFSDNWRELLSRLQLLRDNGGSHIINKQGKNVIVVLRSNVPAHKTYSMNKMEVNQIFLWRVINCLTEYLPLLATLRNVRNVKVFIFNIVIIP